MAAQVPFFRPQLPEYKGGPGSNFRLHISDMQLFYQLLPEGVTEAHKKTYLMMSVRGAARVKVEHLMNAVQNVEGQNGGLSLNGLRDAMKLIFCPPSESLISRTEFIERKQGNLEDILSYFSHKRSLYDVAYPPEEGGGPRDMTTLNFECIKGVYNPNVRAQLFRSKEQNTDELVNLALHLVSAERSIMACGGGDSISYDGLATSTHSRVTPAGNPAEPMEIGAMGPVKCYNCGLLGHISRNCPRRQQGRESGGGGGGGGAGTPKRETRECNRCFTRGHLKDACKIPAEKLEATRLRNKQQKKNGGGRSGGSAGSGGGGRSGDNRPRVRTLQAEAGEGMEGEDVSAILQSLAINEVFWQGGAQ